MSASREKKVRQEQQSSGYVDPKTAREAKARQEEKRSNRIYLLIAAAFVAVAVISMVWKSGVLQRGTTAVTIDGQSYTAAETQYYFVNNYQSFINQYYYLLSYMGLDTSTDLRSQECGILDDGSTWFDYFMNQATQNMATIQSFCTAAEADGMTWNDEMEADLDEAIASLQESTDSYNASKGTSLKAKDYLQLIYGNMVTVGTYKSMVKKAIQAQYYADAYQDSLTYTEEQLESEYAANLNSYDYVSYELLSVSGKADSTTDDDGNTVDPTEEETAAALEAAKELADSLYQQYLTGVTFVTLDKDNDDATLSSSEKASYSDSVLMNWLFDSQRQAGDCEVLFNESSSVYYVVHFLDRYRDETKTVDVRHILIQVDTDDLDEESETYEADLQARKDEAKARAEELLAQWKAGDATEDSFAALANEHSADSGSNTVGGLYEQVSKGTMVDEFDAWCFDDARKVGDTGVVYGESSYYMGYHVMFYSGDNLPAWQVSVNDALADADYDAWYSEHTGDEEIVLVDKGIAKVG